MHAKQIRLALMVGMVLAGLTWLAATPPFPQDVNYHDFADRRTMLGIPHALNVVSNVPFIVFGLLGVAFVIRPAFWTKTEVFTGRWQRAAFLVLFFFVALTGCGSWYYHWHPGNATLYWDRLPLTVVFMTFFALVVADRVSPRWGPWLWIPLVGIGIGSVTYWQWTEWQGKGDVRIYALVQFLPLLMLPVILIAFPARQYRTASLTAILAWYVLAKLLELLDAPIYSANGLVSGHTLKHLVASLGALWILVVLARPNRPDLQKTREVRHSCGVCDAAIQGPAVSVLHSSSGTNGYGTESSR